ncbi:hypothetical protein [Xenorhabdus sp. Sc-CR9]|uniref:hypothetical protein n=1 Tax=Xenorhabdus sp. Sc-CR9 TaxID=2584468 RepID=UPI001F33B816|nr:hypothetical protein [Xenorhabdus sp. Sc-CR9]
MFNINKFEEMELKWAPKPLLRISDVFVFPFAHANYLDQDTIFNNYYPLIASQHSKLFYIRSHGDDFCITPYSIWERESKSAVYSIGAGVYENQEVDLLLIEVFDKTKMLNEDVENISKYIQSSVGVIDVKISNKLRWNAKWINISIVLK